MILNFENIHSVVRHARRLSGRQCEIRRRQRIGRCGSCGSSGSSESSGCILAKVFVAQFFVQKFEFEIQKNKLWF